MDMTNDLHLFAAVADSLSALQHGTLLVLIAAGFTGVVSLQIGLAYVILTRLARLDDQRARIDRLAEGVALLTDATDAGLSTVLSRLQPSAGRPRPASRAESRSAVRRRVVGAARKGESVAGIAQAEALSESEVRLHLSLAGVAPGHPPGDQAAAS